MNDIMLVEIPMEERRQILKDSCDQIEERYYTRKFNQRETNEKREEFTALSLQAVELSSELQVVKDDYKDTMKPLNAQKAKILAELKAGGEHLKGDVYKFLDHDEGKACYFSPEGFKLEERDLRPDERQRSLFQHKDSGTSLNTGTDD